MAGDVTIYVVDDDDAVRESLSLLLETSGFAVRAFAGAVEFLEVAASLGPGCLIADVRMPGMDGLELQKHLAERGLNMPMIVITGHGDVPMAVRAMKAGAVDFVEKPFAEETIIASVRQAVARLTPEQPRDELAQTVAPRLALLSPREREVLEGLVAGLPNKAIAYDLSISPRTVEIHRARVMDKMQARSLSELVRFALAAGIQPKAR